MVRVYIRVDYGCNQDTAGSIHSISQLHGHGPSIQLGADTVPACDHVRLQAGTVSAPDLSLDRHASVVSWVSFYWLRQLRRVRRSLDDESAVILVHAFVTSRVDYCNLLLAGAPKSVTESTDKLQRVMNAAARVVSGTKKYDCGLTHCFTLSCVGSMWQIESHTSLG